MSPIKRIFLLLISCLLLAATQAGAAVTSVTDYTGPFSITSSIDFGTVATGSNLQPELVIVNTGSDDLLIGDLGFDDGVNLINIRVPFDLRVDSCSGQVLGPGDRCSVIVIFEPDMAGTYMDSISVEFPGLNNPVYTVSLTATAIDKAPEPDILVSNTSIDFGSYDPNVALPPFIVIIRNDGGADLDFSSIGISGPDAAEFEVDPALCLDNSPLPSGVLCQVNLLFLPAAAGSKSAFMTIQTNDPDEGTFIVEIFAHVRGESDDVPASIEDAGLNMGDGDYDGILDSAQSNVASLPALNGLYITLVTDLSNAFTGVSILDPVLFDSIPDSRRDIGFGVLSFSVDAGVPTNVGLYLPDGYKPESFYIFGPTSQAPDDHWYEFQFDETSETGAQILGTVIIEEDNSRRNLVVISFRDGARGDNDQVVNGVINVQGVLAITPADDSGAASGLLGTIMVLLMVGLRRTRNL